MNEHETGEHSDFIDMDCPQCVKEWRTITDTLLDDMEAGVTELHAALIAFTPTVEDAMKGMGMLGEIIRSIDWTEVQDADSR